MTLAFALGLGRRTQRRLGAGLFGSLDAMMIAHGALPCDAGCEFVTPAGSAHNLLGLAGISAAIAGVWLCGRQSPAGAFRTWSAVVAVTSLSSFVLWIALAKVAQIASLDGTLQRVFVAILLGWMFVTAVRELQGSSR